jgi:hypothetical protein
VNRYIAGIIDRISTGRASYRANRFPPKVRGIFRRNSIDRNRRVLIGVHIKNKGRNGAAVRFHLLRELGDGRRK